MVSVLKLPRVKRLNCKRSDLVSAKVTKRRSSSVSLPPASLVTRSGNAASISGVRLVVEDVGFDRAPMTNVAADFGYPPNSGDDDFFFDQDYRLIVGAARNVKQGQVVHLDARRKIADIGLDGLPHLGSGITWEYEGGPVLATPNLSLAAVDVAYIGGTPEMVDDLIVEAQEMFGVTAHPTAAGQPIRVTLLSPAGRPVQTTTDLPGFWRSSYADVRKDMRCRYPKHPWPEDPTQADPTLRTKRKT